MILAKETIFCLWYHIEIFELEMMKLEVYGFGNVERAKLILSSCLDVNLISVCILLWHEAVDFLH